MKNTLTDLNNHLFDSLERLMDEDLTEKQFEKEITRSKAVTEVAEQIIENGKLAFKAMQHLDEYGKNTNNSVPEMLEVKECVTPKK